MTQMQLKTNEVQTVGKSTQNNPEFVVYFLQSGNKKHVKIGHSCNLRSRIMNIGNDVRYGWAWEKEEYAPPYTVLGFLPGNHVLERELLERFDEYRVLEKGYMGFREWFYLRGDLADYILYQTIPFTGFDERGQPLGIPSMQLPLDLPPAAHSETEIAS